MSGRDGGATTWLVIRETTGRDRRRRRDRRRQVPPARGNSSQPAPCSSGHMHTLACMGIARQVALLGINLESVKIADRASSKSIRTRNAATPALLDRRPPIRRAPFERQPIDCAEYRLCGAFEPDAGPASADEVQQTHSRSFLPGIRDASMALPSPMSCLSALAPCKDRTSKNQASVAAQSVY